MECSDFVNDLILCRPVIVIVETQEQARQIKGHLQTLLDHESDLHIVSVTLICPEWTPSSRYTMGTKILLMVKRVKEHRMLPPKVPPFIFFSKSAEWLACTLHWAFKLFRLIGKNTRRTRSWVVTISDRIDAAAAIMSRFENTCCIHTIYNTSASPTECRERHMRLVEDFATALPISWTAIEDSIWTGRHVDVRTADDLEGLGEEGEGNEEDAIQLVASSATKQKPHSPRSGESTASSTSSVTEQPQKGTKRLGTRPGRKRQSEPLESRASKKLPKQ